MANSPSLTVGMAVYDDFDGVYFSVQALRLMHAEAMPEVEIVVVDNHPDSPHGKAVQTFLGWVRGDVHSARYVPMPEPVGTSAPRDRVFREAAGKAVLCMDSHVLPAPGSIKRLLDYYQANPGTRDLLSGPMLYDDLKGFSTHFEDVWRGEMWGTWGTDPRANNPNAEPFEIPAQGLGLFTCRKDAWLGFNPNFRGFGGEEWYYHTKVRQSGAKCLCLPFLRWGHRFGRPAGVQYPLTRWNKVRNYVLGHRELGLSLDRIYQHFVARQPDGKQLLTEGDWELILAGHETPPPGSPSCSTCGGGEVKPTGSGPKTLWEAFAALKTVEHDFRGHEDKLEWLALSAKHITELGGRRGSSTLCLLAGGPETLRIVDPNTGGVPTFPSQTKIVLVPKRSEESTPEPTDLLVIDTNHNGEQLIKELNLYAPHVSGRIVIHDTVLHATSGEGGKPGLVAGIRTYLESHPEWFIASHDPKQYGLTVLSRIPNDRPAAPIVLWLPTKGPGTELMGILAQLGIRSGANCDCKQKAAQMDTWGVAECRNNRDTIVGWLRDGQTKWGWKDKLLAAKNAVTTGLVFTFNPLDPFPGLVDEAIRRAEQKEASK